MTNYEFEMQELLDEIKATPMPNPEELVAKAPNDNIKNALPIAEQIYLALKVIIGGF